jgi:CTP synthase
MEILERADHPFFLGTQFHPEFRSRPDRASPPFVAFLDAVLESAESGTGADPRERDPNGGRRSLHTGEDGESEVRI